MKSDLWRIAEEQANSSLQNSIPNSTTREIDFLEQLVGETKPQKNLEVQFIQRGYHYLVYSQFRYPPPVPSEFSARFKPPLHMNNVFYGALEQDTVYREYGYHFLRQRLHVKKLSQWAESRTIFTVAFDDPKIFDLHGHPDIAAIMHKTDYSASHSFVLSNKVSSILYPSARFPGGKCVAVNEIGLLAKEPNFHRNISLTLDAEQQACRIRAQTGNLNVLWSEVS